MAKFYFTYGLDEHYPYVGGWTEVVAHDTETAIQLFRIYHPDKIKSILHCADFYTEEQFSHTKMYKEGKNFGEGCHEIISVTKIIKRRKES